MKLSENNIFDCSIIDLSKVHTEQGNITVVKYRIHENNISKNLIFEKDYENFVFAEILPYLITNYHIGPYLHYVNLIVIRRIKRFLKLKNKILLKTLNFFIIRNSVNGFINKFMKKENRYL